MYLLDCLRMGNMTLKESWIYLLVGWIEPLCPCVPAVSYFHWHCAKTMHGILHLKHFQSSCCWCLYKCLVPPISVITGEDWEVLLHLKEWDLFIAICLCQATSNCSRATKSGPSLWSQALRSNWSIPSISGLYQICAVMFQSLGLLRATLSGLLFFPSPLFL